MDVSGVTAKETRDQFLTLLVTQLQHQDPLEPMKQEDFLSQLAQFSTLEGIEGLNTTIESQVAAQKDALLYQQVSQSAALVGRKVTYEVNTGTGRLENRSGDVESVAIDSTGVTFKVGRDTVKLAQIKAIAASSGTPTSTTNTSAADNSNGNASQPTSGTQGSGTSSSANNGSAANNSSNTNSSTTPSTPTTSTQADLRRTRGAGSGTELTRAAADAAADATPLRRTRAISNTTNNDDLLTDNLRRTRFVSDANAESDLRRARVTE